MLGRILCAGLFSAALIAVPKPTPAPLHSVASVNAQTVQAKANETYPQPFPASHENGLQEPSPQPPQTTEPERPPAKQTVVVHETVVTGSHEDWMTQAGIPADQWAAVDYINSRESVWCPTRWQGEYGTCPAYHGTPTDPNTGYGLCQSTPAWKMASAGEDWATNPVTQLKWCTSHALSRHGGWWGGFAYWQAHHNW